MMGVDTSKKVGIIKENKHRGDNPRHTTEQHATPPPLDSIDQPAEDRETQTDNHPTHKHTHTHTPSGQKKEE
jgi:hypothetical protein